MKKINLSITGCLGRMGKQLIKSSKKSRDFKIVSITENKKINKKIFGLRPSLNSKDTFKKTKVIIDFTVPKCTMEVLKIASKSLLSEILIVELILKFRKILLGFLASIEELLFGTGIIFNLNSNFK